VWKVTKEPCHLLGRFKISLAVLKEAESPLLNGTSLSNAGDRVLQGLPFRGVVVYVVRRYGSDV
jgi:hypothetical protein